MKASFGSSFSTSFSSPILLKYGLTCSPSGRASSGENQASSLSSCVSLTPSSKSFKKSSDSSKSSDSNIPSTSFKKLSTAAIAFIVIGCISILIAIVLIAYFVYLKRKNAKKKEMVNDTGDNLEKRLFMEEE
jgi:hypothetical protein